jgi:hypothetical protein
MHRRISPRWLQGMMGGIKGQLDCIRQFSEVDFTEDLKRIDVHADRIRSGCAGSSGNTRRASRCSARMTRRSCLRFKKPLRHSAAVFRL